MSSPTESSASSGVVRDAIDLARFSWIRPLVREYARNFGRVAALFAGNPADPAAWEHAITRIAGATRDRASLSAALARQLTRRSAPSEALAGAAALGNATSVAIVTGQQVGVFGGPLYTIFKAVTAIQLARRVRATTGVEAVPVFWADAEDHDWAEVRSARILDRDSNVVDITAPDLAGAGQRPVGSLIFDEGIAAAIDRLAEQLPPTEFSADVVAKLRRSYHAGAPVGTAFAGWLDDLLGRHGLVVFESNDPAFKPLIGDLFARELKSQGTSRLARAGGDAMERLGHARQVDPSEDAVALFYMDGAGRTGLRVKDGTLAAGSDTRSAADWAAEATDHPERFSPNVLLRPLVQDRLFPTICYVGGPAELAYQAQLGGVYREFGIEAPLLFSRASATLLDGAAMRFLERSQLAFETLNVQDDSVLNQWLATQLPPGLEQALDEADALVRDRVDAMKSSIAAIDPTLAGAVDTTRDKMRETLKTLHGKIIQAAKRKDDTLRRQFLRTRALAFPDGTPQERSLSVVFFANRYGMDFADQLLDALPLETDKHYLLTL